MINNEIKAKEVRLVGDEEKGVRVISTVEAQKLADEQGLDLICISNHGDIPVVKIGDYNKFIYEKQKKEKENKKKAKLNSQELKEIQISDSIAENDLKTKAKNIDRILKEGDKVKLSIRYKGRMARYVSEGIEKVENLEQLVTYKHKIDKPAKIEGNTVSMVVSPLK